MGNTDDWLLDLALVDEAGPQSPHSREVARWCAAQLSDPDRAFVRGIAPTIARSLGEGVTLLASTARRARTMT